MLLDFLLSLFIALTQVLLYVGKAVLLIIIALGLLLAVIFGYLMLGRK